MPEPAEVAETQDELLLMEYLDGELEPSDRRRLEDRLAEEPRLRSQLSAMEQSWHSLDMLERVNDDKSLVETTLETVIVSVEEEVAVQEARSYRGRWWYRIGAVLLILFTFSAGYLTTLFFTPDPNLQLLKEMPIIERFDRYRTVIDDADLLLALTQEKVFYPGAAEGMSHANNESASPKDPAALSTSPRLRELQRRFRLLEAMDPGRYAQFYRNHQHFYELKPDECERYRRLHQKIATAPDPWSVDATLTIFSAWFRQLSTHEKAMLTDPTKTVAERVAMIRRKKEAIDRTTSIVRSPRIDSTFNPEKNKRLAEFLMNDYPSEELDLLLNLPPMVGYSQLEQAYLQSGLTLP